jgi:hypothetical protein
LKKLLYILLLVSFVGYSQNVDRSVYSSAGNTNTTGGLEFSWTIGEPVTFTISNASNIFTQGFHQPDSKCIIENSVSLVACDSIFIANTWVNTSSTLKDTLVTASNCDSIVTYNITIYNNTNSASEINGIVYYKGNPVNGGIIQLIEKLANSPQSMTIKQQININSDGSYSFKNVVPSTYLLKAAIDTAVYPNAVPTYGDSTNHWQKARVITINTCLDTLNNNDIHIINFPTIIAFGNIYGTVVARNFKTNQSLSIPLEGLDIFLTKAATNTLAGYHVTNTNGEFEFLAVDTGFYKINAEILGFSIDTTVVVYIPTGNSNVSIELCIDTVDYRIKVCNILTIKSDVIPNFNFSVYPNPFSDYCTVNFVNTNSEKTKLKLMNAIGQEIWTRETHKNSITIHKNSLENGLYVLEIINSSINKNVKLIIKE